MSVPDPFVHWGYYRTPEPPSRGTHLSLFFFAILGTVLIAAELFVNGFQPWILAIVGVTYFLFLRAAARYEEWKVAQQ